jgi:squalene-hopene/tetraprenyl-beta-curcumene cyclase
MSTLAGLITAPTEQGAPADARLEEQAAHTLAAARQHLVSLQHEEGWWKGELQTNVTMDAEDLLLRQFLGVRGEQDTQATARWIRSQQRADGTWATYFGGPADLSTTFEAYVALRLAGDGPADDHMAKAAAFVRGAGGLAGARVFTRVWMALFGLYPWDELPALPPEVIFLPSWFPLNIYDFACWARQTIVALTVVAAYRPVRALPFGIEELQPSPTVPAAGERTPPASSATRRLQLLDRLLHRYERLTRLAPVRAFLRRPALSRAERWIVRRQESDGGWGGIQPPWVYSMMALHLSGYALDHPVMRAAFAGLESFTVREEGESGEVRRLEACQSPVWDTALAAIALCDAGYVEAEAPVRRATDWLVGKEIRLTGDWSVRRPGLEPGGWAFEFANDNYPDIDDTAEVVLALRRAVGSSSADSAQAVRRGVGWVSGMVSADGGWGAFDADNTRRLCRSLPFCDFGEVIDPPSADVTAHVVEMLASDPARGVTGGRHTDDEATELLIRGGVDWLTRNQEADGSWFGRWGANFVYGTGAVVPALVAAGVPFGDSRVRRAVAWLERHQGEDGGWGEDLRSYRDPGWTGRGVSTASQSAWALLALIAAGEAGGAAARAGVEFLVKTQRPDGNWDEPYFTGTGFPGDFYINYHLYRLVFPVSALGRWLGAMRKGENLP